MDIRAAIVCSLLSGSAGAQGFNIDFSVAGGGTEPSSTYSAAGGQAGFWNRSDGVFPAMLKGLDGIATSVTLTGTVAGTAAWPITGGSDDALALMNDGVLMTGTMAVHINGLTPGYYSVFLYGCDGMTYSRFTIATGYSSHDHILRSDIPWSGSLSLSNYSLQNVVVTSNGAIDIRYNTSLGQAAPLNGLQIVPIPGAGIGGLGLSAGILACSRRRR